MRKFFTALCVMILVFPLFVFGEEASEPHSREIPEWAETPLQYGERYFGGEGYMFFTSVGEGKNSSKSVKDALETLKIDLVQRFIYSYLDVNWISSSNVILFSDNNICDYVSKFKENISRDYEFLTDKIEVLKIETTKEDEQFVTYALGRIPKSDLIKMVKMYDVDKIYYRVEGAGDTEKSAIEDARMSMVLSIIKDDLDLNYENSRSSCSKLVYELSACIKELDELYICVYKVSDNEETLEGYWTAEILGCVPRANVDCIIEWYSEVDGYDYE